MKCKCGTNLAKPGRAKRVRTIVDVGHVDNFGYFVTETTTVTDAHTCVRCHRRLEAQVETPQGTSEATDD